MRDYAEEEYLSKFCDACGASPCTWDGLPDGFHTDLSQEDYYLDQRERAFGGENPDSDSYINYLNGF